MTVAELIKELQKYPKRCEVTITDGYRFQFYRGNFKVTRFTKNKVDIGVGGCDEETEDDSEETDAS